MKTRSALFLASLVLVAACGGTDDEPASPASTISSPSADVTDTPTSISEPPSSDTPTTDSQPSSEITPSGWVESIQMRDSNGDLYESVDDPRFTSFVWIAEGCCDAGLEATFGSPELPDSDDASDLGDGLYLAAISGWDPAEPEWLTMEIWRVVDCGSDEAADIYYCSINDFLPGRYEALETSETFRIRLDANFSVQMSATLEPVGDDEYYTSYSWLGQGPDFAEFLSELHAAYSVEVVEPYRSGETLSGIATAISEQSDFRLVVLDGPWAPFGLWQQPGGPALSYETNYDTPDSWVPMCYQYELCVDGGIAGDAPPAFTTLIGSRAGLHVVNGRIGFLLLGAQLGG